MRWPNPPGGILDAMDNGTPSPVVCLADPRIHPAARHRCCGRSAARFPGWCWR
ncbi:hypothetical protein I553_1959 [Mycobacterium xenopi 4042]|uniref:Uncharacterized protein n=1 Tax=Mycobacterium xenopi 4042 TaxID=1299334 RepID=X8DL84_MYCXE|nr:hypothetical protein I553_1959 [Mycobacterium xenopi 4042]